MRLTEFLPARITEDEAAAREPRWLALEYGVDSAGRSAFSTRLLAECEAKRAIVVEHEIAPARRVDYITTMVDGKRQPAWVGGGCYRCHDGEGASAVTGELGYCDTLLHLAAIYANHSDYRPEWKP